MRTGRLTPLALVTLVAASLVACVPAPDEQDQAPTTGALESAIFSQYQSIEGFDSASYGVDDPSSLAELETLLEEAGVGQQDYATEADPPPGSLTTSVSATWEDGHTSRIEVWADGAEFEGDLTTLVTGWRESGAFEPIPVP